MVWAAALFAPLTAHATLTVSPIAWNIVGLDSNDVNAGPNNFPVGARVCSNVATSNVAVNFVFDSANANVNLRGGSLSSINIASIGAGACEDAYFEAQVTRTAAAYDTARRYHITATDFSGTASTATPRELFVEHLVSQSRNSITDVKVGTSIPTLASVPAGGSMNLIVGETYVIQLIGGTATQGYEQFEAFINFSNTVFQIQSVDTSYSADNSPFVPNPNDKLYADACLWQNDPNSPIYRACGGGDFKAGGSNVVTTYLIKIIAGGGTTQTLTTLLYDFSGSSYHYNGDYSTSARLANIIDPTSANITKSFSPNPTSINGISVLSITLTNPNTGTLAGYNFVDNLPANLTIANPSGASSSGCGAPTLTATAGSSTISFSNGTLAANGTCVIKVNVTPSATGSLVNTTNHLFVDTIDTTHFGTATLTVNNAPPPGTGICGATLANWSVPNGTIANPPDLAGGLPTVKATNVATATLAANVAGDTAIMTTSGHIDTTSWDTFGYKNAGQFIQFTLDASLYTGVQMSFWVANPSPANGPTQITVTADSGAGFGAPVLTVNSPAAAFTQHTIDFTGLTNTGGNTLFRISATGANNDASGASLLYDDMVFSGCFTPVNPTIAKAFAPASIAVNGVSTLTFTLTNTNPAGLTGATFSDSLPAGVQVAATPAAATTCGGTWTPAAGNTTLNFSGGTIPASGSCTLSVNVTATTAGPHTNVSGFLSTTESGLNPNSVASATLTAVLPPQIAKQFAPSPILPGGVSTLTFTLTNPNQNDALAGVAFSDTFPVVPGAMVVAATPNATTTGCGAPTFAPAAGAGSIGFSGGTLAPGGSCSVSVDVTAPVVGTYNNTSGNVSHIINAQTINGNTASDALTVDPPHPAIGLLKQVGLSPAGPWTPFVDVSVGTDVYYQFTIENTGDVPLSPISLTDNTLDVSSCNAAFASITLPVAVPANDNHIVTCVLGPVAALSGSHTNTAHATGTFNATPVNSPDSSATYATTGLTLAKSVTESTYTLPGDTLHYSYLVTNSGFATLQGPVTVSDDKATVTCPAVSTVGDLDNFLDPGESITCTATYIVTASDVVNASVTNTASATIDGVASNNDSRTVPLSTSADVSLDKTLLTAGPFLTGQSISYTLTVANAGPSTATNIQVTDTPSNLTITNVSGSGCAALPCTIASLASGANTAINVTATINASGAFDNSATATAAQPDPNNGNNTDNTNNGGTAGTSADVSLVKTLTTVGPFVEGQSISYTLFVANAGPSTATSIQVTDTPTNLTITNVSGSGCAALPCTIASLASGANATINVTATINAAGAFDNTATATATETDPNPADNTDNTNNGGTAAASADVSIVKTLTTAGPFTVGQSISYTLFVANAGPSTATNVQVTDTPSNLTVSNVSGGGCAALPCTIASLASGANTTINVTATINAAGVFDNTATATATETDPNPANNTDSTNNGGTAAASADVSIVKTLLTAGPYTQGQSLSYTLFVANAGPSTATSIQVTDTPTNLTITNVSGSGCAALPCTIPSLASGANATINVTATINAAGAFDNSSTAVAVETDPNPANNTDNTNNGGTTAASADVSLVKTLVTAGPYTQGQSLSYTLFVANAGPSTATNVQVTDTPTNLTITNVSGGGCATLPCTIASLASGANATINVTATINAAGAFDNSSTAVAVETDPNPANNTDSTNNGGTAAASADVSIVKTLVTAGPYTQGQSLSYTLFVANAGPSTATSIQVTDTPTNLTITNVSGSGCAALPCTIPSLASGANATINVTATINAAGAFDNTSTAVAVETDPNPANNTDNTNNGGTTAASADVSLVKTLVTAGPYTQGQSLSYTLFVANAGPSTATNVQVTDTPTNLTITNVSGGGCAALPCTIPTLASGANATINVTATINAAGAFDNTATATATQTDPNPANNTDSTNNGGTAAASADVSIVKTLTTVGPFTVGQSISYTLVVANAGPSTATNIQVTDTPTNLTITNVSGGGCAALPCTIPSLASGANATINVTATINAAGAFDNTATATATEPDPNPANNTDSTNNGGTAGVPQLTVTKSANPTSFTVGVPASYAVTVTNTGSVTTSGNIIVDDTLPTGITLTSASGTNWSCTGTTTLSCTFTGTLAPNANSTLTLNVSVGANAANGNNSAVAHGGGDGGCPNAPNCTGTVQVSVVAPQLATTKTGVLDNSVVAPSTQSDAGDTIAYTITVANNGSGVATAVTLTDALLPSLSCAIGASPATLPADLNAGASLVCTATYTLTTGDVAATSVTNTATASAGNVCNPSTAGSICSATTTTPLAVAAVIDTSKVGVLDNTVVAPNNQSDAGDRINYTITVTNSGNGSATGINVADAKLPALSCTIGGNPTPLPATIPGAGTLTCTGTYTLTAGDIASGTVTNSVTVSGRSACATPSAGCSATDITPLTQTPQLALTKTASPNPFVVGHPASYAITITNSGPVSTTAPITVSDNLPTGIALTSANGASWTCSGTTALTCTFSGTLAPSTSTVLTLNVSIAAAATTGNNTATASGGGDPACVGANRCANSVPVTITRPGAPVVATPVDARWALWLLTLALLLSAAKATSARRRR